MPDGENVGHNSVGIDVEGLTHEKFSHHVAAITRQKEVVKAEQAKLGKLRKGAKADGVVLKELDACIVVAEMTRNEQEDYVRRMSWYLEMLRVPVGTQIGFEFDKPKEKNPTEKRAEEKAVEAALGQGYRAGLAEKPESENPHDGNSPAGQAWLKGWQDGIAALNEELREQTIKDESVDIDEDPMEDEGDDE